MAGESGSSQASVSLGGDTTAHVDDPKPTSFETSPYCSPLIRLRFASGKPHSVHRIFLQQHPKLALLLDPFTIKLDLDQISPSAGHILIQYLYTGRYQALRWKAPPTGPEADTGMLKVAFQVYTLARDYEVAGLEQLAREQISALSAAIDAFAVIDVVKETYPSLVGDDAWFPGFIKARIKAAFEDPKALMAASADTFPADFRDGVSVTKVILRGVLEAYSEKVESLSATGPGSFVEAGADEEGLFTPLTEQFPEDDLILVGARGEPAGFAVRVEEASPTRARGGQDFAYSRFPFPSTLSALAARDDVDGADARSEVSVYELAPEPECFEGDSWDDVTPAGADSVRSLAVEEDAVAVDIPLYLRNMPSSGAWPEPALEDTPSPPAQDEPAAEEPVRELAREEIHVSEQPAQESKPETDPMDISEPAAVLEAVIEPVHEVEPEIVTVEPPVPIEAPIHEAPTVEEVVIDVLDPAPEPQGGVVLETVAILGETAPVVESQVPQEPDALPLPEVELAAVVEKGGKKSRVWDAELVPEPVPEPKSHPEPVRNLFDLLIAETRGGKEPELTSELVPETVPEPESKPISTLFDVLDTPDASPWHDSEPEPEPEIVDNDFNTWGVKKKGKKKKSKESVEEELTPELEPETFGALAVKIRKIRIKEIVEEQPAAELEQAPEVVRLEVEPEPPADEGVKRKSKKKKASIWDDPIAEPQPEVEPEPRPILEAGLDAGVEPAPTLKKKVPPPVPSTKSKPTPQPRPTLEAEPDASVEPVPTLKKKKKKVGFPSELVAPEPESELTPSPAAESEPLTSPELPLNTGPEEAPIPKLKKKKKTADIWGLPPVPEVLPVPEQPSPAAPAEPTSSPAPVKPSKGEVNVWGFVVDPTPAPKPDLIAWGAPVPYSKTRKSIFDNNAPPEPTPVPTPTPEENPWLAFAGSGTPTKRKKARTFSPEPAAAVEMAPIDTSVSGSSSGFGGLFGARNAQTESPAALTGPRGGEDPWGFWGARRGSVSRVTPRKTL
ncbi:hypothetical protein B0H67DRAFT_640447 [Lasiosphaeris hirsuta]|uniref:BTB domain-containing protein n=1 Tax=Lasiosphaeris hirsuta TaxID=260670 RepID=A0AA40BDC8_9PEZI|nr:hypothetical protein B0H67DRAFT_640447 [Lasiosphaeris hirsuta]